MDVIAADQLRKHYGLVRALDGLHLRVPAGAIFGFLGPNGAGKTTTIRILLGLMRPTAGTATVFGLDAWRDSLRIRERVGYLPGDLRLHEGLTGRGTLTFFADARRRDCRAEIERLAARFEVDLGRRVRAYSKGNRQKIGLIQALMHRPELLILDEPTASLDPLMQRTLYEELREAAARGTTILFSSHTLSEVEALCEHVAIVRAGRLVECERIDTLRARAVRRVECVFADGPRPDPPPGLRAAAGENGRLIGSWTGPVEPLLAWLARSPVTDVTISPPDLETLFMTYYGDEPRTEGQALT
ncbi:MAG: ABC transporter ATP-binding protein [Phycisphaerae bacterium]|nr:ABC transporter ATP-binding protein [Phycisphaerae bacterium]NUQ46232.1 ABC transporter ATP-binding protein [Phycisphaerae bacterium]